MGKVRNSLRVEKQETSVGKVRNSSRVEKQETYTAALTCIYLFFSSWYCSGILFSYLRPVICSHSGFHSFYPIPSCSLHYLIFFTFILSIELSSSNYCPISHFPFIAKIWKSYLSSWCPFPHPSWTAQLQWMLLPFHFSKISSLLSPSAFLKCFIERVICVYVWNNLLKAPWSHICLRSTVFSFTILRGTYCQFLIYVLEVLYVCEQNNFCFFLLYVILSVMYVKSKVSLTKYKITILNDKILCDSISSWFFFLVVYIRSSCNWWYLRVNEVEWPHVSFLKSGFTNYYLCNLFVSQFPYW